MKFFIRSSFLAMLCLPVMAPAWGRQGHQTVALVAQGLLSPAARRMLDGLRRAKGWESLKPGDSRDFRQADEDLTAFCRNGDLDLGLGSDWADAWRQAHPETEAFHFVNAPLGGASRADMQKACGDRCVVSHLSGQIALLQDKGIPPVERLQALLWVLHLMGDIHQPLHCADQGDFGGNRDEVWVKGRTSNLHAAWDSRFFAAKRAKPQTLAAQLLRGEATQVQVRAPLAAQSPWDWALESFGVAKGFVYPQYRSNHGDFDRREVDLAWPVLRRQLAKAGVRLAAVLNAVAERE